MVRDPLTGKYRRTRLFVLTLGHNRKSVRLLVFRSSSRVWADLHERAFRRQGGSTRVVVLDNLREGVLTPDNYDPSLSPLCHDVLKHCGAVALPVPDARPRSPAAPATCETNRLVSREYERIPDRLGVRQRRSVRVLKSFGWGAMV